MEVESFQNDGPIEQGIGTARRETQPPIGRGQRLH